MRAVTHSWDLKKQKNQSTVVKYFRKCNELEMKRFSVSSGSWLGSQDISRFSESLLQIPKAEKKKITYLTEARKLDPCRWENTIQLKQCLPSDFEGRVCLTSEIPKVAMGWGNDSVDKGSKFKSPGPMWKSWACDFNSSPMGNWRQENHWGLQESQLNNNNKPTTKRQDTGSGSERLDWGWVDEGVTWVKEN